MIDNSRLPLRSFRSFRPGAPGSLWRRVPLSHQQGACRSTIISALPRSPTGSHTSMRCASTQISRWASPTPRDVEGMALGSGSGITVLAGFTCAGYQQQATSNEQSRTVAKTKFDACSVAHPVPRSRAVVRRTRCQAKPERRVQLRRRQAQSQHQITELDVSRKGSPDENAGTCHGHQHSSTLHIHGFLANDLVSFLSQ